MADNDKTSYDSKGNQYKTYKNLFGEEVTYDKNGNVYRSYENSHGEKVTTDGKGNEYRTYEDSYGVSHTYDRQGNSYTTGPNLFGDRVTHQTGYGTYPDYGRKSSPSKTAVSYASGSESDSEKIHRYRQSRINPLKKQLHEESEKKDDIRYYIYFGLGLLRIILIYITPSASASYAKDITGIMRFMCIPGSLIPFLGEFICVCIFVLNFIMKQFDAYDFFYRQPGAAFRQFPFFWIFILRTAFLIISHFISKAAEKNRERKLVSLTEQIDREIKEKEEKANERIRFIEKKIPGTYAYLRGDSYSDFKMTLNDNSTGQIYFPDDIYHYYRKRNFEEYESVGWRVHKQFSGDNYHVFLRVNLYSKNRSDDFSVNIAENGTLTIRWVKERDGLENSFWSDETPMFRIPETVKKPVQKEKRTQSSSVQTDKQKQSAVNTAPSRKPDAKYAGKKTKVTAAFKKLGLKKTEGKTKTALFSGVVTSGSFRREETIYAVDQHWSMYKGRITRIVSKNEGRKFVDHLDENQPGIFYLDGIPEEIVQDVDMIITIPAE